MEDLDDEMHTDQDGQVVDHPVRVCDPNRDAVVALLDLEAVPEVAFVREEECAEEKEAVIF